MVADFLYTGLFWKTRTLKRNELLKSAGTIDTNVYFIESGSVCLYIEDQKAERMVRFWLSGKYPGFIGLETFGNKMLGLLEKANLIDLEKTKTSISISKWIKLKLGDIFRIVVYHNLRHIRQAENLRKMIIDRM